MTMLKALKRCLGVDGLDLSLERLFAPSARARLIDEGAVLGSRAVMVLASVATGAVTARALGPVHRGEYFYAIATVFMLAQFVCLGLPSSNIYFAAKKPGHLRTMLIITLAVTSIGCGAATAAFYLVLASNAASRWRMVIGWPLAFSLSVTVTLAACIPVILAGMQRYVSMSVLQIVSSLVGIILVIAVAFVHPSIVGFTLVVLVSSLLMCGGAAVIALGRAGTDALPLDRDFVREWMRFSMLAVPSLVLGYILTRGTVYSAKATLSPEIFGVFTIAYQIFEALINLPQTISMVMYPKIVRSNDLNLTPLTRECLRAAGICAVSGALGIVLILPFITVVFGKAYAGAGAILVWYLPALVAYAVVGITNQFLTAMHFPMSMNIAWVVCAVVAGAGSYFGGKTFGAEGVAAGTSLGWIVAAVIFLYITRREIAMRKQTST
jgi:O-antigen/teichoic acid export membrane protein